MGPLLTTLLQVGVLGVQQIIKGRRNTNTTDGERSKAAMSAPVSQITTEVELYGQNALCMGVGLLAKLAKADGAVSKEEVREVEAIFTDMGIAGENRQQAIAIFRAARDGALPFLDLLRMFDIYSRESEPARRDMVFLLLRVACAESDAPSDQAEKMIRSACQLLGQVYQERVSAFQARRQTPDAAAQTRLNQIQAAHETLGCSPDADDEQLRQRYRQLVRDFHPDTIAGKGLSAEFARFAEEKFKQIQAAYELLMKARHQGANACCQTWQIACGEIVI